STGFCEADWDDMGIRYGDLITKLDLDVPSKETLASATIDYGRVFSADDQELRRWFNGVAVVVGEARSNSTDQYGYADGRTIAGCYGQAVGISALLHQAAVKRPTAVHIWLLTLGAASIGCLTSVSLRRRSIWQIVATVAWIAGVGVASLVAYSRFQYLCI